MEDTTPSGNGAVSAQPDTTEAVATEAHASDQVITTDSNGTPTMMPVTSQDDQPSEVAAEAKEEPEATPSSTEAPAEASDKTDEEIAEWSEKKGLKINPDNPNEVRLARMQLENERKFHESTQTKPNVNPIVPEVEYTGDPNIDTLVESVNTLQLKQQVRDWFDANPDARALSGEMQRISDERPHLNDLDAIYALAKSAPNREAQLKQEGGRQALTNLAQKQQAVPPSANATNGASYETSTITPSNVYELIDKNDQEWFQKNYKTINKAISGK